MNTHKRTDSIGRFRRHSRADVLRSGALAALLWASAAASAGTALAQDSTVAGRQPAPGLLSGAQFNPAVSVVLDGAFYRVRGEEPGHLFEEMRGFGHVESEDGHEHGHGQGFENGFNLRHLEIVFAADVDPYFRAWATVAVDEHGAEIEEAVVQSTALPGGFQLKLGKFFSDISRQNAMHAHEWNFVDMPLINHLLLGDHGLNEKGVQLSWLAPTPFFLTLGVEALQGENENLFAHIAEEDGPLPERDGPRLFTTWAKAAPMLRGPHALQVGVFGARGVHQEAHRLDELERSHWLDGHQWLVGADFVYRLTPPTAYGQGWLTVEGGYIYRKKDLELVSHNAPAASGFIGNSLVSQQDGLYLQSVYGILPRWRVGLRGDLVGLVNKESKPSGESESFDASYRISGMVDWTLTEFSRLRFQLNHGKYETDEGKESATEAMLQAVFTLGAHGAHRF